jgi:hypothetical protein
MHASGQIKARILAIVSGTTNRRIRPLALERQVQDELEVSKAEIRTALLDLMRRERLVYTYRDPCSYVEIP